MSRRVRRAAVLVVHGIGRQPPLASAARVAQGLFDALQQRVGGPPTLHAGLRHGASPRPFVRLQSPDGNLAGGFDEVDIHEFAWQRLIAGRARPLVVLAWLLGTGLAPLHLRRFWRVLSRSGQSPWWVVGRSLLWTAGLLAALLLVGALLLAALSQVLHLGVVPQLEPWPPQAPPQAPPLAPPWVGGFSQGAGGALVLLSGLLLALLAGALLWGLIGDALEVVRLRRSDPQGWEGRYAGAARSWAPVALLLALGLILLSVLLIVLGRATAAAMLATLAALLAAPGVVSGGLALIGWWLLLRWLRTHVGDIALYVRGDIDSAHVHTRTLLQSELQKQLRELLDDAPGAPRYDALILMGHSLGAVLALDALDALAAHKRVDPAPSIGGARVRGLLTFGAPLDKVAYFFHERIPDGEAVHAQLARYWRPTRRAPERSDLGRYHFAESTDPYPQLRWLHLHAPSDPISDPLVFYRPDEVRRLVGVPWWRAHGSYWQDPRTYLALRDLLAEVGG